jgi:triacylglycerol lipase
MSFFRRGRSLCAAAASLRFLSLSRTHEDAMTPNLTHSTPPRRHCPLALALLPLLAITTAACGPASPVDDPSPGGSGSGAAAPAAGGKADDPWGGDDPGAATAAAPRFPIVLVHGFGGSPENLWGFYRVAETLQAAGARVHVARLSPFSPVARRAHDLQGFVDQALADQAQGGVERPQVNLIAHSMGGLDSRELISVLGYGDRVASLTTLSTPHRGSAIADAALGLLPGGSAPALDALAGALARTFTADDLAEGSDLLGALADLSEAGAAAFNDAHPDDPRVYYQSYAGVSSVGGLSNPADTEACDGLLPAGAADAMNPLLVPGSAFVSHLADKGQLLPNDGMATVDSARWGDFRGCVRADHLDEVGQLRHDHPDRRTGFDHLALYRTIAQDLAVAGF